jgi:phosphoribosylamine--glycine ligase
MLPAQDFKRLHDGGRGPNTGGMGAFAPVAMFGPDFVGEVVERVVQPCVDELARRGAPFTGLLYAGLAVTRRGFQVVEFNARFGDPETQPLLELLDSPLGQVLHAAATGDLHQVTSLRWKAEAAVAVVLSAAGYPDAPRKGDSISGVEQAERLDRVAVLQAGTATGNHGQLVTAGGRVLAVTATGSSISEARERAYAGVSRISFAGAHYRTDIAAAVH